MKHLKLITAGAVLVILAACAQPGGSAETLRSDPESDKRGDAWLGNASSFPKQR